ncbi:MAG: hypothetical protein CME62_01520 [Halobacteriovoraceae bacterium]|nr:hypothetical protein [Halobacteriovoraceae bacterium]|tara:strand:- start:4273 stop:4791 length:519 start_codon:yes stop_codon:yes gene_type:complete
MMENFKSYLSRGIDKASLIEGILQTPEHGWMKEDSCTFAHMQDFFERIPSKVLKKVFVDEHTILVPASGKYACAVRSHHQYVVLVFSEVLQKLSKYNDGWAKAVLAHELGHIFLDHHKVNEDIMESQVDADAFACDMGYLEELESFLHDQPESVEKRVRLSFLTTYYFSQEN